MVAEDVIWALGPAMLLTYLLTYLLLYMQNCVAFVMWRVWY